MIEKSYNPTLIEKKYYKIWEERGSFSSHVNAGNPPYCIIMPPANVTGTLHLGHALTFTIQDILIRYHRMLGKQTLWQPGTDHAGIATQIVVEKNLKAANQPSRHDLGREAFLEEIWDWKETSGGAIIEQLKRLGASADWSRERFTMDDASSKAVTKVFVDLHKEGLIYRDKRLVNWDCALQSAISDLEVDQKESKGHLYYIKYPIANSDETIVIATTRPETFFGDTAVAVHPEDERYTTLIGQKVSLPVIDREIPVIADIHSDPEKGSGAVKITPAHDFNDFEVGQRHKLPAISILDDQGCLNDNVPTRYQGLSAHQARALLVEELDKAGLLLKTEEVTHAVPYSDRSGTIIEPRLTDQWFLNAERMAVEAIRAVEDRDTSFIPENWERNYFEWMRNIQPWCISRQIWWGHQIPAFYGPDGKIFVAESKEEAIKQALAHYGTPVELTQDPDVLDTWFSSALWPFTTLDWPHKGEDLEKFYPSAVLVTGFDIIFFWVARMMMMGLHFMKKVPFRDVYIHALVRDAQGQKMSKSKGNIIDPLELIDTYGADAVRFTLASLASPGRDVKISTSRVEGGRNFATKIWNASRYLLMNGCTWPKDFDPTQVNLTTNRWIIRELYQLNDSVTHALDSYNIHQAAQELYQFTWKTFCDWFLEFSKPILQEENQPHASETRSTLGWVLGQTLHLLHPMMPFMTEELWHGIGGDGLLITGKWPKNDFDLGNDEATDEMTWTIEMISALRSLKAEMNIAPGTFLTLKTQELSALTEKYIANQQLSLKQLGRIDGFENISSHELPQDALQIVVREETYFIPIGDVLDIEAETKRLEKSLGKIASDINLTHKRLNNEDFMARAPLNIVEENRSRLMQLEGARDKVQQALNRLMNIEI